ncbi:MAG TPA: hypothetical protein VF462_02370 [Micromonosporaceae bacterium]
MLVNRELVRRWLSAIVHSPVPRRPLLVATSLTAAAAIAAGPGGAAGSADGPERVHPVSVAGAAATGADGAEAVAARGSGGKNDRAAKIAAAREKATRGKTDLGTENRSQADLGKAAGGQADHGKAGRGMANSGQANQGQANQGKANQGKANRGKADRPGAQGDGAHGRSAPSDRDLMPAGTPGGQSAFKPSAEQVRNAEQIVRTGERMKMPPRAQVIAVATALQESKLQNLGHLGANNDHDSLGLFQQRPSVGWGTPKQLTDPDYAAEQFYRALQQVPGYTGQPLTQAAQTVQVSAFPDAYAQWEKMAADLVRAEYGEGPYARIADGK